MGKTRHASGSLRAVALFLTLAVLLAVPAVSASAETTLDKIMRTKEFNVGYIIYWPASIRDPNTDKLTGVYIDMTDHICETLKVKCVYHETTWATFSAGLSAGKFDLSIAATYATIPRAAVVAFTEPLNYLGNGILVKKTSPIKTMADLKKPGVRVSSPQGTATLAWAENNLPDAKLIVTPESGTEAMMAVVTGQADAAVWSSDEIARWIQKNPGTWNPFEQEPFDMIPVSWAMRRGDYDLHNLVNASIRRMQASGLMADFEKMHKAANWYHPKVSWQTWEDLEK